MLYVTHKIRTGNLWANLHLLFCLSLIPFSTGWMGENHFAAALGMNLFMAALAYWLLQYSLICSAGDSAILKQAIGADLKGKLSILLYAPAILLAFQLPLLSQAIYLAVALMWLVPDRRIESVLKDQNSVFLRPHARSVVS